MRQPLPRVPMNRIAVLIGVKGATAKSLRYAAGCKEFNIDSETGDVEVLWGEPGTYDPVKAMKLPNVIKAIGRGMAHSPPRSVATTISACEKGVSRNLRKNLRETMPKKFLLISILSTLCITNQPCPCFRYPISACQKGGARAGRAISACGKGGWATRNRLYKILSKTSTNRNFWERGRHYTKSFHVYKRCSRAADQCRRR